jgi:hypothetical protein
MAEMNTPAATEAGRLPELPQKVVFPFSWDERPRMGYTADQMRDYALAALSLAEPGEAVVAYNCAKATPAGGACGSWCGNRQTCISTETAVCEVVAETGAMKDMRLLRFFGECPPVGTKLYTHPAAPVGVSEEMVERAYHFVIRAHPHYAPSTREEVRAILAEALQEPRKP